MPQKCSKKQIGKIVEGLPGVLCHLDDILVYGANMEESIFG